MRGRCEDWFSARRKCQRKATTYIPALPGEFDNETGRERKRWHVCEKHADEHAEGILKQIHPHVAWALRRLFKELCGASV